MGIKNIKILLNKCDKGIYYKNINDYRGQIIGVDYSNLIYKYIYRTTKNNSDNT